MKTERTLGFKELLSMSIGTVIGAGIITLVGVAFAVTGRSVWVAYVFAVVVGFFYALPYLLASSIVRLPGGAYAMVSSTLGRRASGVFAMGFLTNMLQNSLFGLAFGMYINSLFPQIPVKVSGCIIIVALYLISISSTNVIAKVQNVTSVILVISLAVLFIPGMFNLQWSPFGFSEPGFFTNGMAGIMDAMVILVFSTQGYYLIINMSGLAKNPRKDMPKAMLLTALIIAVLYALAGMVTGGVLPYEEMAGQPLTYVAQAILAKPLVFVFVFGGACMALVTTLNGLFTSYGQVYLKAGLDGWYPKWMSKTNKHNKPVVALTLMAIVAVLPILLDFDVRQITNNILLIAPVVGIFPILATWNLPKKFPEFWSKSIVHLPDALFKVTMVICIAVQVIVAFWSVRGMTRTAVIVSLVVMAAVIVLGIFRASSSNVKIDDMSEVFAEE
ncbi:MAG: APC family permease [Clostridiales Family XIII bacterium]|jgi:APA family basic amino acid/polyamine antiporter|nr:APC family permease [Clostridiales Family XIII bacterium]